MRVYTYNPKIPKAETEGSEDSGQSWLHKWPYHKTVTTKTYPWWVFIWCFETGSNEAPMDLAEAWHEPEALLLQLPPLEVLNHRPVCLHHLTLGGAKNQPVPSLSWASPLPTKAVSQAKILVLNVSSKNRKAQRWMNSGREERRKERKREQ